MTGVLERALPRAGLGVDGALECLRRHGDHTSGFLMLNRATERYADPGIDGFVAYRSSGRRHVVQLCGPVAAGADRSRLLQSFLLWAAGQGRRVTAVQLTRAEAELQAAHGFRVNQLGSSYSIDLAAFSLAGTRFMRARNKVKRARRSGVSIDEWDWDRQQDPAAQEGLALVDRAWLQSKGRHAKELRFMVGERSGPAAPCRRLLVASRAGRPVAYATYSPCFGARPGWLYDLTRRLPDAPAGTIELLFTTAIERLREEGCGWLHLGLTPMAHLAREHELPRRSSALATRVLELIAQHGDFVYPARSQEQFKLKWAPQVIEPEYIGFAPRVNLGGLWNLLRITRAI